MNPSVAPVIAGKTFAGEARAVRQSWADVPAPVRGRATD
jgi:hypothetical protein